MIIVSHSVGNFYANVALRTLPDYVPNALESSLADRPKENALYPKPTELIGNVQIASPVSQTVNNSPWVSFKDDQVLNWIRRLANVLPGNVAASGASSSDLRAHSLVSYLRVSESKNRIVQEIKATDRRLKYPIPYFRPAATVEYQSIAKGESAAEFSARFDIGGKEITWVDEKADQKNQANRLTRFEARCYDLHSGQVEIRAESISEDEKNREFLATGFVRGADPKSDKKELRMKNSRSISRWKLGEISVSKGEGKQPLRTQVRFSDLPQVKQD